MDVKDLRIETALGERNDGSKYSQSGVALQCNRNKSYQDTGSNPLAKAEGPVRPCAVIGPDRVVPPSPASNDVYLKKASVDLWSCSDNLYPRPPEYPHKQQSNVNPIRNISPRQTFQENMQRILVPPTYGVAKNADESNLNQLQDRNAALSKNTKQTMAPEAKYCEVPYAVNLLTNEHKNVREMDMCVPSVNPPLTRTAPHGWLPSGVNLHNSRTYGAHEVYQYPQYPSCAGPRPPVMPVARPHRTFQEEAGYVYQDSYYQDPSVRFKPYSSVKEHNPQARYDYISNYSNSFHPPPPYASHKYDIPNTRPPNPYSVYPHLKYLDNRVSDPNLDVYQRPNQPCVNYNMQFRNQAIHPTYAPTLGNTQSKLPSYPPDASIKTSNKLSFENNKAFIDYENSKAKYSLPDSYFVNEMPRSHQVQKPMPMPNYGSPGLHPIQMQQYHRKDNMGMRTYEYMPHYRPFEHIIGFNPSGHHQPPFSPSTLAISPTDSNTSNDTNQTQGTLQEDCGYVSQSSTTSARSVDSSIRLPNDYYRRYDYRYRPIIGNMHMPKSNLNASNTKDKKIDVRQFLSMWNEGDDDNPTNNNSKEITDPTNYSRRHENAKSQDQLYVLGLVNVPNEELAKYEHIQKVSKLPENIKGYNSIELLNQFEEVIESSNINNFKSSIPKEFTSIKDRKNTIKQIVEVLPRPVSPLDVESKISQSVIHKEVGCNFEIKPCSPKMLNVEIAAPVHNILGERAIEKVSNPLSNKAKSPLSIVKEGKKIDGKTACNNIQRQEDAPYENSSCKMVGSPFTANNNMDSVKTNYSMQDLETSSGVCLASLPRLDNEIELNFPEVNQQFINANKGGFTLLENYPQDVNEDVNVNLTISTNNVTTKDDSQKYTNKSMEEESAREPSKLSKFRKSKFNNLEYSEDESNANAIRTDSVIIENPDNLRRFEEIKEKISSYSTVNEEENIPINLTSQNSSHVESQNEIHSHTTRSPKHTTHAMECALDFSLSKSENGLSIMNGSDDEVIQSPHDNNTLMGTSCFISSGHVNDIVEHPSTSSECTINETNVKILIEKNSQTKESDCEIKLKNSFSSIEENNGSLKFSDKSEEYFTNQLDAKLVSDNDDKREGKITFDNNKNYAVDKATSINVIVKHKNRHKTFKSKANIETSHINKGMRHKIKKKCNINESPIGSLLEMHDSSDTKQCEYKQKDTNSVIQNNSVSDTENIETIVSDLCKVSETNSVINNVIQANHNILISESDHLEDKDHNMVDDQSNLHNTSVDESIAKHNANISNGATETVNICENTLNSKRETGNEGEINGTTKNDELEVSDSDSQINQANKYYNDLISESELFVDKTFCTNANQALSDSFTKEEHTFIADDFKILSNSTEGSVVDDVNEKPDSKTNDDNSKQDSDSQSSLTTTRQNDECHENLASKLALFKDKQNIGNRELVIDSLGDIISNNFVVDTSFEEKITENNYRMNRTNISITNKTETEEHNTLVEDIEDIETVVSDDKLLVDNKYTIDNSKQDSQSSLTTTSQTDKCHEDLASKIALFNDKQNIGNRELVIDSLGDIISNNFVIDTSFEEKITENNYRMNRANNSLTNKTETEEHNTAVDDIEHIEAVVSDDKLLVDRKYSIDSGYQSNKKSFAENDESIIEIAGNSGEDSVFAETESGSNETSLNHSCEKNENADSNKLLSDSYKPVGTSSSLANSLIEENKNNEGNKYKKTEIIRETLQTSDLYDSVDANMQILFEHSTIEILSKKNDIGVMVNANTEDKNLLIETERVLDISQKYVVEQNVQLYKEHVVEDKSELTQLDNQKEINLHEELTVKVNIDNIVMERKIDDIKTKDKDCTKDVIDDDDDQISSNFVEIKDMDIAEPCAKYLNVDKRNIEIHTLFLSKRSSGYRGKKLYSPSIQKLIIFPEGKILKSQYVDVTELKPQDNDYVDSITPKIKSQEDGLNTLSEFKNMHVDLNKNKSLASSYEETLHISGDISMDSESSNKEHTVQPNIDESSSSLNKKANKSDFETECIEDVQNDLIEIQDIVFSYPNNSIISQITDNIFSSNESTLELKCGDNNDINSKKCRDTHITSSPINRHRPLKRSFSDSALTTHESRSHIMQDTENINYDCPPKRNKMGEFENFLPNIRRNSVNFEENVSFCILIDDNCVITEESEDKICIAELQEDYVTNIDTVIEDDDNDDSLYSSAHETNVDFAESQVFECEGINPIQEWVEDIACAETVFSDEVAENVVISAPSSPTGSASEYEYEESAMYGCSHTDKVKSMHGGKMSVEDAKIVDTLYRTPHMDIMNKTLLYGDRHVESDNNLSDSDQEHILLESDDWKRSPTHTPDYIDPTHASNDFRLETPENKENVFIKELSPLRRIDDYLDVSSAENETDEQFLALHVPGLDNTTQDHTVHSYELSLDNVLDYQVKEDEHIISTTRSESYTTSSFPEVSSTTSEEKSSSILLKITNVNGSRVSQINENETNNRPRCKFTEKKEYSTSNLKFPNRPLLTKAAQKYIPPIKDSIRDLKVKITLPQQSLLKLKQLKLSRSESKATTKQHNEIPRIVKKPKPNFDDVLKSIDEIQIKRHKEKSKKAKTVVPKVIIKKNENGSHYASTPKKDTYNPDLTGRKWQPWVFLEKNNFIDKMAIKKKTRAIFNYRKKTYVLAEKFKKYKSVCSTKFIISHPKTPGQLKYTIRLQHL